MPNEPTTCRPEVPFEPVALPPVLSVGEAARFLRVDAKTIRALLKSGKLRGGRIGRHWRIRTRDVEALLGDAPGRGAPAFPDRAVRLGSPGRPRKVRGRCPARVADGGAATPPRS